jgi:hypothetical protein
MGLILRFKVIMLGQYGDSFNVVTLDCHNLLGLVPTNSLSNGKLIEYLVSSYHIESWIAIFTNKLRIEGIMLLAAAVLVLLAGLT